MGKKNKTRPKKDIMSFMSDMCLDGSAPKVVSKPEAITGAPKCKKPRDPPLRIGRPTPAPQLIASPPKKYIAPNGIRCMYHKLWQCRTCGHVWEGFPLILNRDPAQDRKWDIFCCVKCEEATIHNILEKESEESIHV